jgi:UDP-3-O-[3-hydroxymyristoyl] glucosamine N-acyltransferase
MQLAQLAKIIGATVVGDETLDVTGVATLDEAGPGDVSFLSNLKYADRLKTTKAGAVVVAPGTASDRLNLLHAADPYFAFCKAVVALVGYRKHSFDGVHPLAFVEPSASLGENTRVYPFCYVGANAKIGRDCTLFPGVVIYDNTVIGDRVTIHANTVVGQDGFGYATHGGVHHKIPQAGNAIIGDDVEMGALNAIQRATLGSTSLGSGSKMGDLADLGHGVKIGDHALVVGGCTGIAGSVTIGHHVTIGGHVAVSGHQTWGDRVSIGGGSLVIGNQPDGATVAGVPAVPIMHNRRVWAITQKLPAMLKRIEELEAKVEALSPKRNGEASHPPANAED